MGRAEDWRDCWSTLNKSLIIGPTQWKGEYYVKFWDPQWRSIMIKEIKKLSKSYGGIFLDNVDACEDLEGSRPDACKLMPDSRTT